MPRALRQAALVCEPDLAATLVMKGHGSFVVKQAGAMDPSKSVSGAPNVRGYTASQKKQQQKNTQMILLCNNKSAPDELSFGGLVPVIRF